MRSIDYAVVGSAQQVDAWSRVRLPFEPKGWLLDYRTELRIALRAMTSSSGGMLLAEYETPDNYPADLENVLLYNIGSGSYSHLLRNGLVCRRVPSRDDLHRVSYRIGEPDMMSEFSGRSLATGRLHEAVHGSNPLPWWLAFRERLQFASGLPFRGEFAVTVELGSRWHGPGLAAVLKPLLDGLVSALHVHDGSSRERITAALGQAGDGQRLWSLLNDPTVALLGERRLIRPHGSRIAWNPADELCASFRVVNGGGDYAVAAEVLAIGEPSVRSAEE